MPHPAATRRRFLRRCWLLAPLPALLFLLINLSWFGRDQLVRGDGVVFTGMIHGGMLQGDQPTYTAMARAVFRNGNGLLYSNPFDDEPDSPRVLCNLGYVLLGWLMHALADHAVLAWEVWRLLFGTLCFGLWGVLVARVLRDARLRWATWGLGALGGGWAWLWAFGSTANINRAGYLGQFFTAEGDYGWWALNLFRQALYPLELYYHTLVLAALLTWHTRRYRWLPLLAACAWWSHLITAVKLTTVLCLLLLAEWTRARRRGQPQRELLLALGGLVAVAALFGSYYQYYLPSFPAIAVWGEQTLAFLPLMKSADWLPAFGPLLTLLLLATLLAGPAGWRRVLRRREGWLALAWGGATLLLLHNHLYLLRPIQPLHFCRGHLYLAGSLLVGLLLQEGLRRRWPLADAAGSTTPLARPRPPRAARLALGGCLAIGVLAPLDNVLFAWRVADESPQPGLLRISTPTQQVLDWFRQHPPQHPTDEVIFTFDQQLGVLLVAQTPYRVYASENVLTPWFTDRMKLAIELIRRGQPGGLQQLRIRYLVLDRAASASYPAWCSDPARLRPLFANERYRIGELQR